MAALNWCNFRKDRVVCSSAGAKSLGFSGPSPANFQPILDCFIPDFKLKKEDSENIKFASDQTWSGLFLWGGGGRTPGTERDKTSFSPQICKVLAWLEESKQKNESC